MILALIPAREGSKGILNKNLQKVAGVSLFQRAINAAKESKKIDKIVVSTDSKKILARCKQQQVEFICRPKHLATDKSPMGNVVSHAYKIYKPQFVVLLQPSSPFRTGKLIDQCIKKFLSHKYDTLATGYYAQLCPFEENNKRRQQLKKNFYDDGNIYILGKKAIFLKSKFGKKNVKYVLSKKQNVEIDTQEDLKFAQEIAKNESKK